MAPKKNIEIRHRSTLTSCPRVFYTKFVTEIVLYMKEILDEDKSICFIHLYLSIVQINRAKKLSDEPLKLSPSIFFTEGFIGQYSATQARDYKPPYLSLFLSKLKDIYVLMLPFNIQVLIFVAFE